MSEIPHFELDETETAYREERTKQKRERRRLGRWQDRYWLRRLLIHLGYWSENIDGYWDRDYSGGGRFHDTAPGRKLPQELKYERWRKRATDYWPRYDKMIHQWQKRHDNRCARQRERVALRDAAGAHDGE